MPLYDLMRDYEERRQALVDQLKNNPGMDAATQHQIYGAIKEIEHFLSTLESQIAQGQEQRLGIELEREPQVPMQRTRSVLGKVGDGTRKIVREHIPDLARKATAGPRRYLARRREHHEMRKQIEREMRARMQQESAREGTLPSEVRTDAHALERMGEAPAPPLLEPQHSSTAGEPEIPVELEEMPAAQVGREQSPAEMLEKASPMVRKGALSARKARKPAAKPAAQNRPQGAKAPDSRSPPSLVRKGAPLGTHPKRAKDKLHHAKGKTHPSKHAQGKSGGQHKPHHKGRRFRR